MRYFIFILFFLTASLSYAVVYMEKNKNGKVMYSDTPLGKGEQIVMPDTVDYTPTSTSVGGGGETTAKTTNDSNAQAAEKIPYKSLVITSPAAGETIQNQPTLDVALKTEPALQKGDTVQLYLDGKPIGKAEPSNHVQLGQLERGTHQLSATILSATGQTLMQAQPITIYVQRVSAAISPAFQKKNN